MAATSLPAEAGDRPRDPAASGCCTPRFEIETYHLNEATRPCSPRPCQAAPACGRPAGRERSRSTRPGAERCVLHHPTPSRRP
jgi:hypothetical protein